MGAKRASSHQERRRRSRSSVGTVASPSPEASRGESRESRRDPRGGSCGGGGGGGGRARGDAPRGASHAGARRRGERERGDDGERQDASKDGHALAVSKPREPSLRSEPRTRAARTTVRRERFPPLPRSTFDVFDRGSARLGRRRPGSDRLAKAFSEPRERRERLEPCRASKQETRGKGKRFLSPAPRGSRSAEPFSLRGPHRACCLIRSFFPDYNQDPAAYLCGPQSQLSRTA